MQVWHQQHDLARTSKLAHASEVTILAPLVTVPTPTPVAAPVVAPPVKKSAPVAKPVPTPPSTDIASASACPGQDQIAQTGSVLLCMTNYARKFHGLGGVSSNAALTQAAAAKAGDIVTCDDFSHTACGHPSNYWVTTKGYTGNCSGENIAMGQHSPGEVFVDWMNSAGHRENILRPSYVDLGVAEQDSSHGPVWVMELGGC